jgi:pentatricopeptide repeat protein
MVHSYDLTSVKEKKLNVHRVDLLWENVIDCPRVITSRLLKEFLGFYVSVGVTIKTIAVIEALISRGEKIDCRTFNTILYGRHRKYFPPEAVASFFQVLELYKVTPTLDTFTVLVGSLSMLGRPEECADALRRMRQYKIKPNIIIYNAVIDAYIQKRDTSNSLYYFHRMKDFGIRPNSRTYELLLRAYAATGDVEEMRRVIVEMEKRKVNLSVNSLNIFLDVYSRMEDFANLFKIFDNMKGKGINPDIRSYSIVIKAVAGKFSFEKVLDIFNELDRSEVPKDIGIFNVLIEACCKHNDIKRALQVYKEAISQNLIPNATTMHHFIMFYTNHGDYVAAKPWLQSMVKLGLQPRLDTLNHLLVQLVRKQELKNAAELLNLLKSLKVPPNRTTCNLLIQACVCLSKVDDAIDIFHKMKDAGISPSVHSFNWIIYGFGRSRKPQKAFEWFRRMELTPDMEPNVVSYENLIYSFTLTGDYAEALRWFTKVIDLKIEPTLKIYNTMLLGFARESRLTEAVEVLRLMKENNVKPTLQSYRPLIESAIHRNSHDDGMIEKGMRFYQDMVSLDIEADNLIFRSLFYGLARGHLWDHIKQLLEDYTAKGMEFDKTFYKLIFPFFVSGSDRVDYICTWISDLKLPLNVHGFNVLIEEYLRIGEFSTARDLFYKMKSEGTAPNVDTYNLILYSLCQGLGALGSMSPANFFHKLQANPHLTLDRVSYHIMIHYFLGHQQTTTAEKLYLEMLSSGLTPNIDVLDVLIHHFCEREPVPSKALMYFDEISNQGLIPSQHSMIHMFKTFATSSDTAQEAFNMFVSMQQHNHLPPLETINPDFSSSPLTSYFDITQEMSKAYSTSSPSLKSLLNHCIRHKQTQLVYKILEHLEKTFESYDRSSLDGWIRHYIALLKR